MNLIKKILLATLTITVVSGGIYWASINGHLENTPLNNISLTDAIESIKGSESEEAISFKKLKFPDQEEIAAFTQDATEQTKILSSRAGEISEHTGNILGATVEEGEEKPPIHEKALEYGRYIYCAEVVKDYESRFDVE